MHKLFVVLCLACISSGPAAAQEAKPWEVRVAFGTNKVTGTPERPAPVEGEGLTGATGPDWGWHARIAVQRAWTARVDIRADVFWNQITSSTPGFNAISAGAPEGTKDIYPAARTDEALGIMVGPSIPTRGGLLRPRVSALAGVARYSLTPDARLPGTETLRATVHFRPAYQVALTWPFALKHIPLALELGYEGSMGRGAGSHHFPLTLGMRF